ncbi:MAG: hypothetical protein ACYC7B_09285 [Burkholderiales bacterium]
MKRVSRSQLQRTVARQFGGAAEANSTKDHSLIDRRSPDDSSQPITAALFASRMKTGTSALVSTTAKAAAARRNGKLGGRPRKVNEPASVRSRVYATQVDTSVGNAGSAWARLSICEGRLADLPVTAKCAYV